MNPVSDSNNNVVEQSKVKLPGKIIIVNVHYTFPYISLSSTAKQQREYSTMH